MYQAFAVSSAYIVSRAATLGSRLAVSMLSVLSVSLLTLGCGQTASPSTSEVLTGSANAEAITSVAESAPGEPAPTSDAPTSEPAPTNDAPTSEPAPTSDTASTSDAPSDNTALDAPESEAAASTEVATPETETTDTASAAEPVAAEPVAAEPTSTASSQEPEAAAPEFPAVDVVDLATGSTVNLQSLAQSGSTLVWFWAPH